MNNNEENTHKESPIFPIWGIITHISKSCFNEYVTSIKEPLKDWIKKIYILVEDHILDQYQIRWCPSWVKKIEDSWKGVEINRVSSIHDLNEADDQMKLDAWFQRIVASDEVNLQE